MLQNSMTFYMYIQYIKSHLFPIEYVDREYLFPPIIILRFMDTHVVLSLEQSDHVNIFGD